MEKGGWLLSNSYSFCIKCVSFNETFDRERRRIKIFPNHLIISYKKFSSHPPVNFRILIEKIMLLLISWFLRKIWQFVICSLMTTILDRWSVKSKKLWRTDDCTFKMINIKKIANNNAISTFASNCI